VSRHIPSRFSSPALRWAVGLLSCVASWQAVAAFGRTPLSDQINAEARFVVASGYMVRSVAEARKINAEAVALEIQNRKRSVEVYYELRQLYKKNYLEEHPRYMEMLKRREDMLETKVNKYYDEEMRHDVTETSNWLLRRLSSSVLSCQYDLSGGKSPIPPGIDLKLTDRDLKLIRLADGGRKGSRLEFSAADGEVLVPNWPIALRNPDKCKAACDRFDRARKAVVKDGKATGKVSHESQTELMQAVNGLYAALKAAYPKEKLNDPNEFLDYLAGKGFVQTLVASAHRAIAINDTSVFTHPRHFQGDSLFGLIQYMYRNGLQFAPPLPGADGEGIYKTLLFPGLRKMYATIGQDQLPPIAQQGNRTDANQAPKNEDEPPKQDEPKKDRDA